MAAALRQGEPDPHHILTTPKGVTTVMSDHKHGMTSPRIYVASLSDYNAGNHLGAWIDIDQDADAIHAEIQAMLKTSKAAPAEDWAIHDFELPGGIKLSEYASIERVAAIGQAIAQASDSEAFAAWYAVVDQDESDDADALLGKFQEAYRGSADTFKDWVMSNDMDVLSIDQIAAFIKDAEKSHYFPGNSKNPYSDMFEKLTYNIDWDMVARDQEHYYTTHRVEGTVYVFDQ